MKSHQPRYAIRKYAVGAASVLIGFFCWRSGCSGRYDERYRHSCNDSSNSAKRG